MNIIGRAQTEKKETFVLAGKLINVMPLMTIIFGVFDLI
jgi:hypothetical protein